MSSRRNFYSRTVTTRLVGRGRWNTLSWRTHGDTTEILTGMDGENQRPLTWWRRWIYNPQPLPIPHLTASQVGWGRVKEQRILAALGRGPIFLRAGFLTDSDRNVLASESVPAVLLWLEIRGVKLRRIELPDGALQLDALTIPE